MASSSEPYAAMSAKKKAEQQAKIPAAWRLPDKYLQDQTHINVMDIPLACGILDETEVRITSDYDATALLEEIKKSTFTVEQVTVAFCKRAAIAHQLTNCLTEIFFTEAITRAKSLDAQRAGNPSTPLPQFFGLPISLKDTYQVIGFDSGSSCLASLSFHPSTENSSLVDLLNDLGAVFYCKTNVPQSVLTGETDNNIFGRTLNPLNTTLTAGGSTGGEGALLAMRGSLLGMGTDIAGSCRVPAACCGIYGLRASAGIVPHGKVVELPPRGMGVVMGGGIRSISGPMGVSMRDIKMFMEVIMSVENKYRYDVSASHVPWVGGEGEKLKKRKLRIGVARDDGVYTASPPMRRGLQLAVDKLKEAKGYEIEVVEIKLPGVLEIYPEAAKYLLLCGGEYFYKRFAESGEPPIPVLAKTGLLNFPPIEKLDDFFATNDRRVHVAQTYLNLWRDNDLDAIMMPPAPHTALPLDNWVRAAYTCLWNYLDYPALVIPVDKVRDEDVPDDKGLGDNGFGGDDGNLYQLYTGPEDYKHAPVCIQLVGYRQRDETLMEVASIIDEIVNKASL